MPIKIPDNLPAMSAGLFGYLSYEMINFEIKISEIKKNDLNLPQSILFRPVSYTHLTLPTKRIV